MWWKKERFKDCWAQKRDRLCGASLLVRVGSPMSVLLTCTPSLTGFHYQNEINEAFVTLTLFLWTRTLWLWTETPFCAGLVLSMSTLSTNGIG